MDPLKVPRHALGPARNIYSKKGLLIVSFQPAAVDKTRRTQEGVQSRAKSVHTHEHIAHRFQIGIQE